MLAPIREIMTVPAPRRTLLAFLGVSVGVLLHTAFGDGPASLTLGWAFSGHTPVRVVPLPVGLVVAVIAAAVVERGWEFVRDKSALARAFVTVAFVDVLSGVVSLQVAPLDPELRGPYVAYISAARLLLLAGAGAVLAATSSGRHPHLIVLSAVATSVCVAVLRLAQAGQITAIVVLIVGGASAFAFKKVSWRGPSLFGAFGLLRSEWTTLAAIMLVGFAARATFASLLHATLGPAYPFTSDDGPSYDELARMMANGDDSARSHYFFNLYPAVLSVLYRFVGTNYFAIGVIQSAYASTVIPGIYLIARIAAGRAVATLAACAVAADSVLLFLAPVLGVESLFVATFIWTLTCLAMVPRAIGRHRYLLAAIAGLLAGLGIATRDVFTLFPLLGAGWIGWALLRKRASVGATVLAAALFLIFAAMVVLPFNAYRARDAFYASSTGIGYVVIASHRELLDLGVRPEGGAAQVLTVAQRDPARFLSSLLGGRWHEADLLLFSSWFSYFDPVLLVQRSEYALSVEVYVLTLGVLGSLLWLRRGSGSDVRVLALLGMGYLTFMYVVVFAASGALRYRSALDPLLLCFVATGAVAAWSALRNSVQRPR